MISGFTVCGATLLIQNITDTTANVTFSCPINTNGTLISGKLSSGEALVLATLVDDDHCVVLHEHASCSVDDMQLHITSHLTSLIQSLTSYMCNRKDSHTIKYFAKPELKFDEPCPCGTHVKNKFILAGTEASCVCFMENQQSHIGGVQWYNDVTKQNTTYTDDFHSVLTVSYPRDFRKNFTCIALSGGTNSEKISFNPQFAYGPTSIETSSSAVTMETCSTTILFCFVPDDVSPGIVFEIGSNVPESLGIIFQTFNNNQTLKITLTSGNKTGMYNVRCRAMNSLFENVQKELTVTVTVIDHEPNLIIHDGHPIRQSLLPKEINIACRDEGSHYAIRRLHIVCLNITHSTTNNVLEIKQYIAKKDLGLVCSCIVEYHSNCSALKSASLEVIIVTDIESNTLLTFVLLSAAFGGILFISYTAYVVKLTFKRRKKIKSRVEIDSIEDSDDNRQNTKSTYLYSNNSSSSSERALLHPNDSSINTSYASNRENSSAISSETQQTVIHVTLEEINKRQKVMLDETQSLISGKTI
ncbi:hypothetical protein Btru_041127 [Bulinus truncatus]|nr:hypothetical protein Btru_041127 [Bulinus truncatus]